MRFTKMHGLGNDFVHVDCFKQQVNRPDDTARTVSDRHRGVGADGLILMRPSSVADVQMEMYNADGSRAQVCGNGLRCVAKYAIDHGLAKGPDVDIETDAGVKCASCSMTGGKVVSVCVDMGVPVLSASSLPSTIDLERIVDHRMRVGGTEYLVTCVSMGNPHAVVFVEDIEIVALEEAGWAFEHAPQFIERINAHFVCVESRVRVRIRTWERGSGVTQACGTGACAACVAGVLTGRTERSITVTLPGGDLQVEWAIDDHVLLTGPAVEVFSGVWKGEGCRAGDSPA